MRDTEERERERDRERQRQSDFIILFKKIFNVGFEFTSGVGLFAFGADIKKICNFMHTCN